ncbi:MAG: dihydrodipicolinate synthase family protein [Acidimicrobiia bacterium]
MTEPVFSGVAVALLTFFDESGRIDAPATAEHAARLVELGISAVVVAGTTGEPASLDLDERSALLEAVRKEVPSDVPVIAGTGAPSARQSATMTILARDHGADAAMVLSPPWVADPRPYYDCVAAAAGELPLLAYHFPAASAPGIPVELLSSLPVVGLKDSSGDAGRLLAELAWDGSLYTGSTYLTAYAGLMGCAGAILALANAEPERCVAAFNGDVEAQRALVGPEAEAKQAFPQSLKLLTSRRFATPTTARIC